MLSICTVKCRGKSRQVALRRVKSRCFLFFRGWEFGFVKVSKWSRRSFWNVKYGQCADLWRPFFTFRFSSGRAKDPLGPEQLCFIFAAIIAQVGHPQGAPLRHWGASYNWGGNSLAGRSWRPWLELFTGSWRDTVQAPGLALTGGLMVKGHRAGTRPAPTVVTADGCAARCG